jgi:2,3-bisphosphoglycerate-independent phosphoglycerate mutase
VQKIEEEPVVVEEPPKKIDKLKEIVACPDCNMSMTVHTLKYIHKRRGFCKAVKAEPERTAPEPERTAPEPETQKTKITQDIVNDYIKDNPDIISNYLRNERAMKAQRKQMNARSLLNNAF